MKTELYRKVYIKSEDDLPNTERFYIVHDKLDNKVFELGYHLEPKYDLPNIWMHIVDWYLLPIEITDSIIEEWAKRKPSFTGSIIYEEYDEGYKTGLVEGAKALRDGEIKPKK